MRWRKQKESVLDKLIRIKQEYREKVRASDEHIAEIRRELNKTKQPRSKVGARLFLHWRDGSETEATFISEKETYGNVVRIFEHLYAQRKDVQDLRRLTYTNNKGDVNSRAFVQPARYARIGDTLSINMSSDPEWGA